MPSGVGILISFVFYFTFIITQIRIREFQIFLLLPIDKGETYHMYISTIGGITIFSILRDTIPTSYFLFRLFLIHEME